MIDLLALLRHGEVSLGDAERTIAAAIDALHRGEGPTDWATTLGLSSYEATAYMHGAPLGALVMLRYDGWPTHCSRCGLPLDYRRYGWFYQGEGDDGKPCLRHITCPLSTTLAPPEALLHVAEEYAPGADRGDTGHGGNEGEGGWRREHGEYARPRVGIDAVSGPPGGRTAVAALIAALASADAAGRADAARALAVQRDKSAAAPLTNALHDPWPEVRIAAAAALGDLGDRRAVEPLIAALEDEDPDVAWNAAAALGVLGDRRAVASLVATLWRALQGRSLALRQATAEALGILGDERALPLLEWMRHHDTDEFLGGGKLRDAADKAIERIQRHNAIDG